MRKKVKLACKIAGELHENNRKYYLLSNGIYEECWKEIKDLRFIKSLKNKPLPQNIRKNGLIYEINISASRYNELSPDWQLENRCAGEVIEEIINSGKAFSREEVGEIIHSRWLDRHPEAKQNKDLNVPFRFLTFEEQEKDWEQFIIGMRVYSAELNKKNI